MAAFGRFFRNKWLAPPKPVSEDYSGRTVIVTGATSGIGREATYRFAASGASSVILTARDVNKGESTKSFLEARLSSSNRLQVWELDMMSYESVLAFAKRVNELEQLDIVILNAGARRAHFVQSAYGWEEDLQVNTLSTTLLAILLLPKLKASQQRTGRTPILEFVNSGLHQNAVVPPEVRREANILAHYNNMENFNEGRQYSLSKAFLMYATAKIAEEVSPRDVVVTSVCPGWVMTNLGRDHYFPGVFVLFSVFIFLFMRTPAQGANTVLSGTTQGRRVHGSFWQHDKIQPLSASLVGADMKQLSLRIWHEIVQALSEDVPGVGSAIDNAFYKDIGKAHGEGA